MKTIYLLVLTASSILFAGCAATRPISDIALAGGGAALANELSHGDPLLTAAGAAGGVLISEGIHYANRKQTQKAYGSGYEKGRSDAVKQQYWILVNHQKEKATEYEAN